MVKSSPLTLPILNQPPRDSALTRGLEDLRHRLVGLDHDAAVSAFELEHFDRLLKTTISLCPKCLKHVEAVVFALQGRVWMRKRCPAHGLSEAIVENDERFYYLSNKDCWGRRYAEDRLLAFPAYSGGCCQTGGCDAAAPADPALENFVDQSANKSCTVLVEVTNACNLQCKVCYSESKGDRVLPLELFQKHMLRLIEQKGGLDSVQLTGGEAMLHPQFWQIVDFLYRQPGVRKIYLPTNGILFARRENAQRLVPYANKVMVLLQFDGQSADTNFTLRNANPARVREQVVQHLGEAGIVMQLTMTLTKGVNDHEVGWVIDTAMKHRHIKLVALQPVTYSGRYELEREAVDRLTLSDVVKAVAAQAAARVRTDDFIPIPCSHPNCGWLTLFVRRWGLRLNIARHIDLAAVMNQVAYKTVMSTREIREMVGHNRPSLWSRMVGAIGRRIVRPTDLFGIAIKPFMDCFNYDLDRISNCCHHLLDTQGRAVSFCEYNALIRTGDVWDRFPKLAAVRDDGAAESQASAES